MLSSALDRSPNPALLDEGQVHSFSVEAESDWQGSAAGSLWVLGLIGSSAQAHAIACASTLEGLLPDLLDSIPVAGTAQLSWSLSLFAKPGEPVHLAALAIEMGQMASFTLILSRLDRASRVATREIQELAAACLSQVGNLENDADVRNARAVLEILGSGFDLGAFWSTVAQTPVSFLWTDDPRRSTHGGSHNLLNTSCYRIHRAPFSIAMLHNSGLADLRMPAVRQWIEQDAPTLLAPPASRTLSRALGSLASVSPGAVAALSTTFDIHIDGGGFLHACAWLDDADLFVHIVHACDQATLSQNKLAAAMAAIDLRGRTPYDVAKTHGRVRFLTRAMAWQAKEAAALACAQMLSEARGE